MTAPPRELPPPPPAGALELATVLSVATRIEPELIRATRLRFLPHLDVGAEADLWFSDWVAARTPEAIALLPECLPYLRAGLARMLETDPRLHEIIEVLTELHSGLSPALLLEERVTWASLTGDTEAAARHLNRALHALVRQNRSGLAGWFAEAWKRLPAEARSTTGAWSLANATRAHVPSLDPGAAPDLTLDTIASIATAVGEARLGVRREDGALLLGDVRGPSAAAILVPDTHPRVIEAVTRTGTRTVRVDATAVVRVEVGSGPVSLRTGAGHVYELEEPAPPLPRAEDFEYAELRDLLGRGARVELAPRLTRAIRDLLDRFRQGDDLEALRQAFDLAELALAFDYDTAFPELGCEAAEAAYLQGVRRGTRGPLEKAVDIGERLFDAGTAHEVVRSRSVLGAARRELFSHTGALSHLDRSLVLLERSLDRLSASGADTGPLVAELLRTYAVLHEVGHGDGDLWRAVALADETAATTHGADATALPLARILVMRSAMTGDPGDLARAEDLLRFEPPPGDLGADRSERAAVSSALCVARFWAEGAREALHEALELARSAITYSPAEGRLRRSRLQLALAEVLHVSSALSHRAADLDEALALAERAKGSLPRASPWRKAAGNILTRCLVDRYRQGGDQADLDRAAESAAEVVSDQAGDQLPYRHAALIQHGECLLLMHQATGRLQFLDQAFAYYQTAGDDRLRLDPAQRLARATGYVSVLLALHSVDGSPAPLDIALTELDAATEDLAMAPSYATVPTAPLLLARAEVLSRVADAPDDSLRQAADDLRRISGDPAAQPLQRLKAALLWGSLAMRMGRHDEVVQSYEIVTRELPPVVLLPGAGRGGVISAWEERSRDAAAYAIEAGSPERALEFLEQRGALLSAWSENSHAEVDRLSRAAPDLHEELRWLWTFLHLDTGRSSWVSPGRGELARARMYHLVEAVRAVPGFDDFLVPVPGRRMVAAASEGPVVVLNATARRCDALLVTRQGVSTLPLPEADPAELTSRARAYHRSIAGQDHREAWSALDWLWESTVRPVLSALGLTTSPAAPGPAGTLPRIWWCPTGPFTMLPLHVAGQPRATALDHAVHSYTPSLRALMTARYGERHRSEAPEQRMLLVLADEALSAGVMEAARIQRLVAAGGHVLRGPEATAANVAARLADHPFFHFIGRAGVHEGVPRLQFESGTDRSLDWRHLPPNLVADGALAYLSAYGTAGDERGSEGGGWTIAASFQTAGYRHVIGTLGTVADAAALRIATDVYELLIDGDGRLRPEHAALALHTVLEEAFTASAREALGFAGVIHLGP